MKLTLAFMKFLLSRTAKNAAALRKAIALVAPKRKRNPAKVKVTP